MTHPRSLEEYEGYFPRFLPISLMREFHRQALESYQPPLIHDPPPDSILDDLVSEDLAQQAATWCSERVPLWVPFTPPLMELRRLRQSVGGASASLLYLEAVQYLASAEFNVIPHSLSDPLYTLVRSCRADLFLKPTDVHAPQVLLFAATFVGLNESWSDSLNPPAGEMAALALRSSKAVGLQGRITRVLAATHVAVGYLGEDQHYFAKYSSLELPTMAELVALQAQVENAKLTPAQQTGCLAVILRCRLWVLFTRCITQCAESEHQEEHIRLASVDDARAKWTKACLALDAERTSLLDLCPSILAWLELEHAALDQVLSGVALQLSLGWGFSPQFFHDVIKKTAGSVHLQAFIQIHGPSLAETAECVLASTSNLLRDELYPTALTCTYGVRAFVTGLEVHAGCFKLWGIPPPREVVWKSVMRGAADTIRLLKGGGMVVRISNAVAAAARETIPRWKAQVVSRPHQPSGPQRPTLNATSEIKPDLAAYGSGGINGDGPGDHAMVSSFAEWIAGIDWNQLSSEAVTPMSFGSGASTSGY
ncbi:hypothetical protein CcaverHIS002_0113420 [Cutaneotrichosporon cavernicola]|uniref:Uncharacterized protein n=1 Tax=Cutaneotrichosporon cavernicola TaxID=279322 RepID=A0AA48KZG6_9TREE|nr:uncharacterized protein CcaverHIS019_0113290 [Cutaneotrichosporon cavernicola]BEI80813.1 hypothetical protein CcaverHIS002_0113420 [Cutaneotrichosporon cavernicola]BEI88611.1 hypothetical protein CcaverHIS019_0113290 [Cutaneotrichosporon cavernicola]BEI96384.1 hypothetical protein CcaverHIS631_0113330 [Cutaneotrichosporon cavernicola]BEJ04156.1 hypothetical protein CcaverHIS641_0113310 [Cutaneotrichosporon cavernicola]